MKVKLKGRRGRELRRNTNRLYNQSKLTAVKTTSSAIWPPGWSGTLSRSSLPMRMFSFLHENSASPYPTGLKESPHPGPVSALARTVLSTRKATRRTQDTYAVLDASGCDHSRYHGGLRCSHGHFHPLLASEVFICTADNVRFYKLM